MVQAQFPEDELRASDRTHVARWTSAFGDPERDAYRGPRGVVVATVPNGPLGYDGVAAVLRATMDDTEDMTVHGRPGLTGRPEHCFAASCRSLVTTTNAGDLLRMNATGDDPLSTAEPVRLAASIRTATAAGWEAFTSGAIPPSGG